MITGNGNVDLHEFENWSRHKLTPFDLNISLCVSITGGKMY